MHLKNLTHDRVGVGAARKICCGPSHWERAKWGRGRALHTRPGLGQAQGWRDQVNRRHNRSAGVPEAELMVLKLGAGLVDYIASSSSPPGPESAETCDGQPERPLNQGQQEVCAA